MKFLVSKVVTVRQVPLTEMESPRCISVRMGDVGRGEWITRTVPSLGVGVMDSTAGGGKDEVRSSKERV